MLYPKKGYPHQRQLEIRNMNECKKCFFLSCNETKLAPFPICRVASFFLCPVHIVFKIVPLNKFDGERLE